MTSMNIVQFSRPPIPFVHLRPNFFHPLDLGWSISYKPKSKIYNLFSNNCQNKNKTKSRHIQINDAL